MDIGLWRQFLDDLIREKGRLESELDKALARVSEAQSHAAIIRHELECIAPTEAMIRKKLGEPAAVPDPDRPGDGGDTTLEEYQGGSVHQPPNPTGHRSHAEVADDILRRTGPLDTRGVIREMIDIRHPLPDDPESQYNSVYKSLKRNEGVRFIRLPDNRWGVKPEDKAASFPALRRIMLGTDQSNGTH